MDLHDNKNGIKDHILEDVGKSIKLVQQYAVCNFEGIVVLGNDSWLVKTLCHLLDVAMRHGLRDMYKGFWPLALEVSHSDTLQFIQSLKAVHTSLGKGRAWIYYTLTEGSLQSYLYCLSRDTQTLHKHYATQALLRDTSQFQQFYTLLAGLDRVQFNLDPDNPYLDMTAYQPHCDPTSVVVPELPDLGIGTRMTSSITSSLASPVDSGVALLDSDADATSVSEATINETDNLSLRDDKDDDLTYSEMEDNRINQQLLTWESGGKNQSSCEGDVDENTPTKTSIGIDGTIISREQSEEECREISFFKNTQKHSNKDMTPHINDNKVVMFNNIDKTEVEQHSFNPNMQQNILLSVGTKDACKGLETLKDNCLKRDIYQDSYSTKCQEIIVTSKKKDILLKGCSSVDKCDSSQFQAAALQSDELISDGNCRIRSSVMTTSDIVNQNVNEQTLKLNSMMSKSCTGYVESKANNDLNVFDNKKQDSNLMSASADCEDIVFRRQRRKKRNGMEATVKRVSFHDDFILRQNEHDKHPTADFSMSFLPPNSVIKRDAVKGRYSWCGEGDAPFVARRKNDSDTKSDVYLSSSTTVTSSEETSSDGSIINIDKGGLTTIRNQPSDLTSNNEDKISRYFKEDNQFTKPGYGKTPPVAERGTPEGQEDPPQTGSTLSLFSNLSMLANQGRTTYVENIKKLPGRSSSVDWSSDTDSVRSDVEDERLLHHGGHLLPITRIRDQMMCSSLPSSISRYPRRHSAIIPHDTASKNSLLNMFMKSITERKLDLKKKVKLVKPSRCLYIKGVKCDSEILLQLQQEFQQKLKQTQEALMSTSQPECSVSDHLKDLFKEHIFEDCNEKLYKVFKVSTAYFSDGSSRPLLALVTDTHLYLTGVKHNYAYSNHFVMPYKDLDSVIIGPNSQTVVFVSRNHKSQFVVATGDGHVTGELVSRVEMAMRRAPCKFSLPAVKMLQLSDMRALARRLSKDMALLEDEAICHYSLVHLQDDHVSPPTTPLGPTKEGHLMFRPATNSPLQPWEPGYFILKAGVIYMFGDKCQRLPKRAIPIQGNHCQGCRRISQAQRPHTFEILLEHHRSFQFAAADEYEASDWLQAFVQSASGVYELERIETVPCSLVVTCDHILTCLEQYPAGPVQMLSCASIEDITAFRITLAEQNWCILEFACREVHESSGDWVLYFASGEEMHKFKETLEQIWPKQTQITFPVNNSISEVLERRCSETSKQLSEAWDALLPTLSTTS